MDIKRFKKLPLLGILRGIEEDMVDPLVDTVTEAGLETIEITMNTPGAAMLIKKAVEKANGRLTIGAGTVLTTEDLLAAVDAGASFMVLPTLIREVVDYCANNSIPVFPGALTPAEINAAWQAGATMVKVFPVQFFGPRYLGEIKAPFPDIELLACGGVSPDNVEEFFNNGASAVSFGEGTFKRELLTPEKIGEVGASLKTMIADYKSWKGE